MKNKLLLILLLPVLSCNANSPFNFLGNEVDPEENVNTNYIKVQKQIQTSYSLLKALNAGAISQDEYDQLKSQLFNF